jgi:hypothetical protein
VASRHFGKHLDAPGVLAIAFAAAHIPLWLPLVDWQTLSILRHDSSLGLAVEGQSLASPEFPSAEPTRVGCLAGPVSRRSVPDGLGAHGLAAYSKGETSILLGRIAITLFGLWLLEDLHG